MENIGRNRLENFEENKAKNETSRFYDELYGEAGKTDFSDEALKRLQEATVYEDKLIEMANRSSDHPLDRFDQSKARDEYELKINDPAVKTMKYYAEQINRLRRELRNEEQRLRDESVTLERHRLDRNSDSQSLTSQYLEQIKQAIKNKEDILQDKLIEYRKNPSAEESIINDIIDMTDTTDMIESINAVKTDTTNPTEVSDVGGDKDDSEAVITFEVEFGKDFDDFARVAKEKLGFDLLEDDLKELFEQYQSASGNVNNQAVSGGANQQAKSKANQSPSTVVAETKNEASAAEALKKDPNFLTKVGNFLKKKCLNNFMVALLLSGAIFAGTFVDQLKSPENLAALSAEKNPTEISLEQGGVDSNLNKTQESVGERHRSDQQQEKEVTEDKKTTEDKEHSYESHKEGDPIHYDAELDAKNRDKLENKNHHLAKLEGETAQELFESLKQANYEAPYMIAQLAFFGHVQLVDKDGNVVPANDSKAVNELIKQMKNSPELFGKNYDIVNKLFQNAETRLTSTGEVFDLKNGYDTTHAYINRQTGELGIGLTQNWQEDDKVLEIKFLNEKKEQAIIRYKAKCGQLIILSTKVDTNTVLIVVQEKIVEVPVEKEVIKEVIKTVEVPVEKEVIKEVIKTVEVPVIKYRDRIVYVNEPNGNESKNINQSTDANPNVQSPGKATGENLQSAGEAKTEQQSKQETLEHYMKQVSEMMEKNRQEEKKQARENYEAEMQRIAEENKQVLNGAEGQANVVTSSDKQAAEAVKQKHEEAAKEAGEAENGINPQSRANQEEVDLP